MNRGMAKLLLLALVATGLPALLVLAAPDLIVIGLMFLIVPGLVMMALPTVFLYLCVFSAVWFATKKQGEARAALYGLAGLSLVALGLPLAMNGKSEVLWEEARSRDLQPKQPVAGRRVVAIDLPRSYGNTGCNELCQLLLFNGVAERVVVRMERARTMRAHYLTRENCRVDLNEWEKNLKSSHRYWSNAVMAGQVAEAAKSRIAGGECLVGEDTRDGGEELGIRWVDENSDRGSGALRLAALPPWNRGVDVSVAGQVVARETMSHLSKLALPLHLAPIGSGMGFNGWHWGRTRAKTDNSEIDRIAMLRRLTAFNLGLPRGMESRDLRKHLDSALSDPAGSSAAFVLLGDYYRTLREDGFEVKDRERLARLILDDRVTDFSYFNWSAKEREKVGPVLRDAILQRLLRLGAGIDDPKQRGVFHNLMHVAARLGPNSYAGDIALLDELMHDEKLRERMPELIQRYADQGKAGAEKLVRIAEAAPSRTGREMDGVRVGLCLVGIEAREFLPRLGKVEGNFTQGHAWRGMLVAMGARASEFHSPGHSDQAKYEEALRKHARACLEKKVKS